MEEFKGESLLKVADRFPDDQSCKKYLAQIKWSEGFTCRKCKHKKSTLNKDHSRTCTLCKSVETAPAGTLFHKCKFGLRKAFMIVFEMSASTRGLSSSQMARRYEISRPTAWHFMHKVRKAMGSSGKYPVEGQVFVDEFVVGGKEKDTVGRSYHTKKKKVVCAVETTDKHKVKRMYAMQIDDYSSRSLRPLFEQHISKQANVITDGWKGYRPIRKEWQIQEEDGKNLMVFSTIHTMIHQVKTTLRTTYSYVSKKYMDRYLSEYCYRINRSIHKQTIFHGLISRMTQQPPIYWKNISSG